MGLAIPEDKLVLILADAHIAEAAMQGRIQGTRDTLGTLYYQQIFQIHQVSEADFRETMRLVAQNPQLANELYGKVLEALERKKVN